jgi:osmotically inducible lipoprotein OsmB
MWVAMKKAAFAHGRTFMTKYLVAIAMALTFAGCGTTNETVGTVGGAALGGVAGSAITGGSTLGTVGGAAAGGYLGHQVGEAADRR